MIKQDFIFELDYFQNRNFNSYILSKLAKEHDNQIMTGYQCFINNLQTSLEFYVYLSYKSTSKSEIEKMKELLFPIGNYRPDVSLNALFNRIKDRGFNSYPIHDPGDINYVFSEGFWYRSPEEVPSEEYFNEYFLEHLKNEGYNAFDKMAGGTTLFISHSSKQKESLEKIIPFYTSIDELIWLDKYRISEDAKLHIVKREIAKGLNEANKVLFFITKEFLESRWCNFEFELAKKIYEEKVDYKLFFIINEDVMNYFFESNKELVNSIAKNDILILHKHQGLEEHIKKMLK